VVGVGVSSVFWVFSDVLRLFSVFLLFWCPCMLHVCLGAPYAFLLLFLYLPIKNIRGAVKLVC
jgi:hypothetical protein